MSDDGKDDIVGDEEQPALFEDHELAPDWKEDWRGMPDYSHNDLMPWQSIYVHFRTLQDRADFAKLVGQQLHSKTKFIWHPKAEIRKAADKVFTGVKVTPRYPIYIISKGRWESRLTQKCLEHFIHVPYHIVIEPQEFEQYAAVVPREKILTLPFSNLGLGGIPARNWVWEHAIASGAERHWILDDNISGFCRFQDNLKVEIDSGASFCAVEDFVDRYENVAMAGFNYDYFAPRKQGAKIKPITWNTRIYSGILLSNSISHRWRGRYNEDTDLSLRILKDGLCTALFNALLMYKKPTLTMKGGNTDELYKGVDTSFADWVEHVKTCRDGCVNTEEKHAWCAVASEMLAKDGRWLMAESLRLQHPDVTTVERKWERWQHQVDYRRFQRRIDGGFGFNEPILRQGITITDAANDYGMELGEMPPDFGGGHDARNAALSIVPRPRTAEPTPPTPVAPGPSALEFILRAAEPAQAQASQEPETARPAAEPEGQGKALAEPDEAALGQPGPAGSLPGEPAVQPRPGSLAKFVAGLHERGHQLMVRDGKLFVSQASRLDEIDRAALKRYKEELLVVAAGHAEQVTLPSVAAAEECIHVAPSVPEASSDAQDQQSVDAGTAGVSRPTVDVAERVPASSDVTPRVEVMQTLAQYLGMEPPRIDPNYVPDEIPSLAGIDSITLNFEATGYRWWAGDVPIGVTIGSLDGQMRRFLPWGFAGGNLDREQIVEFLRREVRAKHITNANTRFEVHMGRTIGVDLEEQGCTVADVQIDAALLDDNRRKFNIDLLAEEFLGGIKVPRVDESRMATYHASEVAARARYQVQLVSELHAYMWPKIVEEDLQKVRQLECDVIYPVCEMERNGAPIDVELLERWVKESQMQYEGCLMALKKETGRLINPNAPSDLEKLFEHLGLPVTRLESGAPSFTDAILKRVEHPLIKQLRFAIKLSDLRSRYLLKYQKVVGGDGILRYALHQVRYQKDSGEEGGTGPGRFSSAELDAGVGTNIQQVMKITKQRKMFGFGERDAAHDEEIYLIRKLVVPKEGQWLCADAEQIEYRIFADYANNRRFIDEYKKNPRLNFHSMIEVLFREQKVAIDYDGAKTYNFATIYGAGQVKRAVMLGFITEEEGEDIRRRSAWEDPKLAPLKALDTIYNRLVPEVKPLLKKASDLAQSRGYVKTKMGRRSRFSIDLRYHKAFNNVDQGCAADYNKVKLVEVHAERKHTGFTMRFTVHDELDGDAREPDTLEKIRAILDRQSWPEMKVPLLWDAKVGRNWAEAK